jgi:8-oxo-dGTP pyrophosphatase MutT (NUDIX family)
VSRPTVEVRAAGGIVRRDHADRPEILVVHRPAYDDWSLPKGKVDPGEDDAAAAVREVLEETGVRAEIVADAGTVEYLDRRDRVKVVRYFSMTVNDSQPRDADDEVDLVEWWSLDRARQALTYSHDRDLVRRVVS